MSIRDNRESRELNNIFLDPNFSVKELEERLELSEPWVCTMVIPDPCDFGCVILV